MFQYRNAEELNNKVKIIKGEIKIMDKKRKCYKLPCYCRHIWFFLGCDTALIHQPYVWGKRILLHSREQEAITCKYYIHCMGHPGGHTKQYCQRRLFCFPTYSKIRFKNGLAWSIQSDVRQEDEATHVVGNYLHWSHLKSSVVFLYNAHMV